VWDSYATELAEWADAQSVFLMSVPPDSKHTAHLFFMLMPTHAMQGALIAHLKSLGVIAGFHYIPLDSSDAGLKYGRTPEACPVGEDFSNRLVRLPLWAGMTEEDIARVIDGVRSFRTAV
jgi:dTDP-4-amino-4,6-dideoxygalactose transaminase